jgi:hypothetical protein
MDKLLIFTGNILKMEQFALFSRFKRTLPNYNALLGGNGNTPKKRRWQKLKGK